MILTKDLTLAAVVRAFSRRLPVIVNAVANQCALIAAFLFTYITVNYFEVEPRRTFTTKLPVALSFLSRYPSLKTNVI